LHGIGLGCPTEKEMKTPQTGQPGNLAVPFTWKISGIKQV